MLRRLFGLTWDQALFSFRFFSFYIPAGKAKRKESLIPSTKRLPPTFLIDWLLPNQPTKITSVACFYCMQIFHTWEKCRLADLKKGVCWRARKPGTRMIAQASCPNKALKKGAHEEEVMRWFSSFSGKVLLSVRRQWPVNRLNGEENCDATLPWWQNFWMTTIGSLSNDDGDGNENGNKE